jgi:hypothetical protein
MELHLELDIMQLLELELGLNYNSDYLWQDFLSYSNIYQQVWAPTKGRKK